MTTTPSRRKQDTLTARVRQFFLDNPGEELTYADMQTKFGLRDKPLYSLICNLKAEGIVTTLHVVKGLQPGEEA